MHLPGGVSGQHLKVFSKQMIIILWYLGRVVLKALEPEQSIVHIGEDVNKNTL
jgi:hypothetical protein